MFSARTRSRHISITSASTLAEVIAEYEDNCDYDVNNSTTKAKNFIIACRFLLRRNPNEVAHGSGRVRIEPQALMSELEKAEGWLKTNDATSAAGPKGYVKHASFRSFRT